MRFQGYTVSSKHRANKPTDDRTQWKVPEWKEIELFTLGHRKKWLCSDHIWSLVNGDTEIGDSGICSAYYAKFKCDNNGVWHGYPVSSIKPNDKPPTKILDMWRKEELITKKQQYQIVKGKLK